MLEHGFRGCAVAREPVEPHLSMLLLVSDGQGGPVHDGEVNHPHVCRAQFLEEGLPKDQMVACIFDGLAGVDNSEEYGDFEQLRFTFYVLFISQ